MKTILWDIEENRVATNWDSTSPIINKHGAFIKILECHCHPDYCCGGCANEWVSYEYSAFPLRLFDRRSFRRFKRKRDRVGSFKEKP